MKLEFWDPEILGVCEADSGREIGLRQARPEDAGSMQTVQERGVVASEGLLRWGRGDVIFEVKTVNSRWPGCARLVKI